MGTISTMVQCRMERFQPNQMSFDELTQPRWGDAVDFFHEQDKKQGSAELNIPAVMKPKNEELMASPALISFGERVETLHIMRGILQMQPGTSRPGSSQTKLGFWTPQSYKCTVALTPDMESGLSPIM